MSEVVRLAIGAPGSIGTKAKATLTELLASSGVRVNRTGSVILDWPCPALPYAADAWLTPGSLPLEADPIAFAHHALCGRSHEEPWRNPVDEVRQRVAAWVRSERLLVTPPWPQGAACAVAVLHDAAPPPPEPAGLRARIRRPQPPDVIAPYAHVAEIEQRHGVVSTVRSFDLLTAIEQEHVRALGFVLGLGDGILIASREGFGRGTAFPARGWDSATERPVELVELPVLGRGPTAGLTELLAAGGAAVLSVPIQRFDGARPDVLADYNATLSGLRDRGVWLATPEAIVQRLFSFQTQ